MAFINKNIAQGLAYSNNWSQDIENSIRNEEMNNNARREREEKIKYYAEITKEGSAFDSYNNGNLEAYFEKVNKELADYYMNNPGFENSVEGMKGFQTIARKFQDNEYINESRKVKEQFEMFQKDLQTNKKDWSPTEIEREMDRYLAYVNQKPGEKAVEPYYFNPPPSFTLNDIYNEAAENVGMSSYMKPGVDPEGYSMTITGEKVSEKSLTDIALGYMNDEKFSQVLKDGYNQTLKEDGTPSDAYPSFLSFVKEGIRSRTDNKITNQSYTPSAKAAAKYAAERGSVGSYWMDDVHGKLAEDGKIDNVNLAVATSAGENGGYLEISSKSGMTEMLTGAQVGENGKFDISKSIDLKVKEQVKVLRSTGAYQDVNGRRYVEVQVEFKLPDEFSNVLTDDDQMDKAKAWAKKNGLQIDFGRKEPNPLGNFGDGSFGINISNSKPEPSVVRGNVLVPMLQGPTVAKNYDNKQMGASLRGKVDPDEYGFFTGRQRPGNKVTTATILAQLNSTTQGDWGIAKNQEKIGRTIVEDLVTGRRISISNTDPNDRVDLGPKKKDGRVPTGLDGVTNWENS